MTAILSLETVTKSFGPTEIIRGVDLDVLPNERHAIIGPNGAGKSTLFHLVSGAFPPSSGVIRFNGEDVTGYAPEKLNNRGLARSFQITSVFPGLSVSDNIRLAFMRTRGFPFTLWRGATADRTLERDVQDLLQRVRLDGRHQVLAGELTYSEQRSLELGMTMASQPRLVLLDEPMAGMSQQEVTYTTQLISELTENCTLLIVEHDMNVVFALADRITVLVYGKVLATGTPEQIRADAKVREAYLGEEAAV
jgi:branched-chain amino acid transport system ATP-binding protein